MCALQNPDFLHSSGQRGSVAAPAAARTRQTPPRRVIIVIFLQLKGYDKNSAIEEEKLLERNSSQAENLAREEEGEENV